MNECPTCGGDVREAVVVCGVCGEVLPLRVVAVSEGSHGGGFAVVEDDADREDGGLCSGEKICYTGGSSAN